MATCICIKTFSKYLIKQKQMLFKNEFKQYNSDIEQTLYIVRQKYPRSLKG